MKVFLIILAVIIGIVGVLFIGLVITSNRRRLKFSKKGWGWKIRPYPKSVMKVIAVDITAKKINTDPNSFAQPLFKNEKPKLAPTLNGWLDQLIEIDKINDPFKPIGSDHLDNYTKQIDAKLPDDYLELIKQTLGLDLEQSKIFGISEIYRTGLDDGNYYHLAEFDDGIIAVKVGDKDGKIY